MKYTEGVTFMHRLDPVFKILISLICAVLVVIFKEPLYLALLFAASASLFFITGPTRSQVRTALALIVLVMSTTMISQGFFYYFSPRTPIFTILPHDLGIAGRITGGIAFYREGLVYGLVQSLRFSTVTLLCMAIVITTHPSNLIRGLKRLRIPARLGFVITVSIRFLPEFIEEAQRIMLAQRLRGLRTKGLSGALRKFSYLMVPLFTTSLRKAWRVAMVYEMRGFEEGAERHGMERFHLFSTFSIRELVMIAFFCCLLYLAGLPFRLGLSRIPFLQAFIFSIPHTAVLFAGIRLVPKAGTALLIITGNSLLAQLISRGINPLWWPYALLAGLTLELYFLLTGSYLKTRTNAFFAGILRGLVVYLYFYCVSAPYIWHINYAPWYIAVMTAEGIAGSVIGALIGYELSLHAAKALRT